MADFASSTQFTQRPGHLRAVAGGLSALTPAQALLRQVGEDVRAAWEPILDESFEPGEVANVVGWIVACIGAGEGDAEAQTVPAGPIALTRFLVERVHSGALDALASDQRIGREDVIQLLRGIDALRRRIEPEWDRYFAAQISGPDGLNMVTEVLHDVRSPLTSIRCLAEMLERGQSGPVTDTQRKQLRLIYSAALGIGSMATDVIEMARQGDQVPDGETVSFSISELLEGVEAMVRPIAEEKGLTVTFGRLASDQRLGVPHAISRVLLNLVTNALKFTDEGGVEVQLRPTTLTRVEFAVVDSGRGIPPEAIPHLFRPFRRSSGRAGRSGYLFSGTGLGLALCRKLLQHMGSELKFETAPQSGTRFFFELDLPTQQHL